MIRKTRWNGGGGFVRGSVTSKRAKRLLSACSDICKQKNDKGTISASLYMRTASPSSPQIAKKKRETKTGLSLTFDHATSTTGNHGPL